MRAGSFSVRVPESRERTNGQAELSHGTQYTIILGNHQSKRCDATLTIDGQKIADFRLDPNQIITVEGPPDGDRGRFTFAEANSQEAVQGGVDAVAPVERGLVEVRFRPERHTYNPVRRPGFLTGAQPKWSSGVTRGIGRPVTTCSMSDRETKTSGGIVTTDQGQTTSAGITVLTGQNHQQWRGAENIDHDPSGEVIITLRLVGVDGIVIDYGVRPLRQVPPMADR